MRIKSISNHLRPYLMYSKRATTIVHAFSAAVAPSDSYDEAKVSDAMRVLGMDPTTNLHCAYCGELAETWDHVFATVKNSRFSGHGHRLGNLLPCCKACNSRKGNRSWSAYLSSLQIPDADKQTRIDRITVYLELYAVIDNGVQASADYERLDEIKRQVLTLLKEGDIVAERIRAANLFSVVDPG